MQNNTPLTLPTPKHFQKKTFLNITCSLIFIVIGGKMPPPLPSLTPSLSSFCNLHSECARKELRRVYTVQPFPGQPSPPGPIHICTNWFMGGMGWKHVLFSIGTFKHLFFVHFNQIKQTFL